MKHGVQYGQDVNGNRADMMEDATITIMCAVYVTSSATEAGQQRPNLVLRIASYIQTRRDAAAAAAGGGGGGGGSSVASMTC